MSNIIKIKPIGIFKSLIFFAAGGIIFAFNLLLLIPWLTNSTEINPFIITQIVNTFLLNIPLFITAIVLLKVDGYEIKWKVIKERYNFRKITGKDIIWIFICFGSAIIITLFIIFSISFIFPQLDIQNLSGEIELRPLRDFELFFLLFMLVSFFFNYVGEEILWRGYLYPRQKIIFGNKTWILSGLLHLVFHIPIGPSLLLFLPFLFAIPYLFHKTNNIYTVIIFHALLGAPMDILLALGIVS